jgi:hypothetical protein
MIGVSNLEILRLHIQVEAVQDGQRLAQAAWTVPGGAPVRKATIHLLAGVPPHFVCLTGCSPLLMKDARP